MKQIKNLLILTQFFLVSIQVAAQQYTNIPNMEFEQILINQSIDSEGLLDGRVLTSDIATVITLDISYSTVSDVTGIEDFSLLVTLNANQASLTFLDVTGLTNLETINLSMNNLLSSLNVTGCLNLRYLNLQFTGVNSLDLSTCPIINSINLWYNTSLLNLDVSGITSLTSIIADNSSLQSLNVTGCTSLTTININETSVNSLNLSNNPSITSLSVYDSGIQSIDLTNCNNFTNLYLWNCVYLSNINLTNCSSLTDIDMIHIPGINSIDIRELTNLENLYIDGSNINGIDATNNINLSSVNIFDTSIADLDLRNGNNMNITTFGIINTNLECINVDDEIYATNNWTNISNDIFFSNDCSTLSANEFITKKISVYPNPTEDYLMVYGLKYVTEYKIYDGQGKILNNGSIKPLGKIEINNLNTGLYFLKIDTNNSLKFIKK